jgi:hypothetical protein
MKTVWVYVNMTKGVGESTISRCPQMSTPAETWFEENDPGRRRLLAANIGLGVDV